MTISDLRKTDNFFLLAGPCVIEGEEMALRIADRIVKITDKLGIPYVFKGSYRKANRSRLDSFTGSSPYARQNPPTHPDGYRKARW